MDHVYQKLLDNSIQASLACIEIYNKPDFKYREQVFIILNINAWELLLKAKILKDNNDKIESLYIKKTDGTYKYNRTGNPLTIEILGAIKKVILNDNIINNLTKLVEIRDTIIHFYTDKDLIYLIYALGVASLRNYQKLMKEWFDRSLLEYNFYILPIGFAYNFKTLSMLDIDNKPEIISNIVKSVSECQNISKESDGFYFICEISTQIISAKKISCEPHFITQINSQHNNSIIIQKKRLIDDYPFSYHLIYKKIKEKYPELSQKQLYKFIKDNDMKNNIDYTVYNFRTKENSDKYDQTGVLDKSTPCLYNENALRFIIENINRDITKL